ncbi:transporter substrate-binding domain-containing protein [Ruminococcus albus]|uniref:Amino acid ABC transporter substrate-binding protein, PAAT family n=1 Tax=Ruminococcus albus TaxID=1264 RepID=A0A1H7NJ31_RUMAL|nr:transporter substrate-binding domain-containing protein [Ruminococcus albus]SEL22998.1 amino acid ABC transporter substrate-binding protein, PAAT family [Ruminococcus albus]
MKRIFATMAAIVISAAVMTACGKTATENTVHSKADLEGKTIGVQLGTTGDSLASNPEVIKNAKVERYNKYADAVQALKQGKVDAVIIDSDTAKEFIKKNDDIELLSEELSEEEYAICMNLDNTALQVEINTVLTEFKTDGTLDTIKEYYDGANAGENKFKADPNADTSKGKLVMATNAGFPPYEYMEGQEIVGFDVDMMTAVCQKLGYELEIDDMEFDSIIPAVQSGKADVGVAGMSVTEDRKKNVLFSTPYTNTRLEIMVRK